MNSSARPTTSTRKSLVKRIRAFSFFACLSTLSLLSAQVSLGAGVAETKAELATPTYGDGNSYQLVENTSGTLSSQSILKYVGNAETGELEAVYYDITFDNVLGAAEGEADIYHYKWVDQAYYHGNKEDIDSDNHDKPITHDGKILVQVTDPTEADLSVRGELRGNETFTYDTSNTTTGGNLVLNSLSVTQQGDTTANSDVMGHHITGVTLDTIDATIINSRGGEATVFDDSYLPNGSVTIGSSVTDAATSTDIGTIKGEFIGNVNWGATGPAVGTNVGIPTTWSDGTSIYSATQQQSGALSIISSNNASHTTNVDRIEGVFIGNAASRGAAINLKGTKRNSTTYTTTIGSIEGDFFNNVAAEGGAAISADGVSIGSITGTFSGNTSLNVGYQIPDASSPLGYRWGSHHDGAAIYATSSYIGSINGDFIGNATLAPDGDASTINTNSTGGAAIHAISTTIGSITGNFISNTSAAAAASTIHFESSTVNYLSGNFYLNTVDTPHSDEIPVAMSLVYSTVNLVADKQSVNFTGNSGNNKSATLHDRWAINAYESTINMTAVDGHEIIFNDGLYSSYGVMNINNGMGVTTGSTNYGNIEFNSFVQQYTINLLAGTVSIGEFAATDDFMGASLTASFGMLYRNDINISAGATMNAYSAYAFGGLAMEGFSDPYRNKVTHNTIINRGTMNIATGTLVNGITLKDGGVLNLNGDVAISYDKSTLSATEAGKVVTVLSVEGTGNKITGNGTDNRVTGKINIAADSGLDISNVSISAHSVITNAAGYENSTVSNARVTEINLGSKQTSSVDSSALAGYKGDAGTLELHVFEMLNVGGADLTALTLEGNITFELALDAADQALLDSIMAKTQDGMFVFQYGEGADGTDGGLVFGDYDTLASMDNLNVILEINGESYQSQYTYTDGNNNYAFAFTAIPEPSTATMSLLALAGLLARRRRSSVKTIA